MKEKVMKLIDPKTVRMECSVGGSIQFATIQHEGNYNKKSCQCSESRMLTSGRKRDNSSKEIHQYLLSEARL